MKFINETSGSKDRIHDFTRRYKANILTTKNLHTPVN